MADQIRLSLADQALINLAGALCAQVAGGTPDEAMYLDLLDEVVPQATTGLQVLDDLTAAVRGVLAAAPARAQVPGALPWASAMLDLHRASEALFRWRAGQALDAWRGQGAEVAA